MKENIVKIIKIFRNKSINQNKALSVLKYIQKKYVPYPDKLDFTEKYKEIIKKFRKSSVGDKKIHKKIYVVAADISDAYGSILKGRCLKYF